MPGDKSVSHRAVLFGAVNDGPLEITGFLRSEDTLASLAAIRALGVVVEEVGEGLVVHGTGWNGLAEPENVIDVANSGTLIRLLPGLVASLPMLCVLTGDSSIRCRPMKRILDPLAQMGAQVQGRRGDTLPPVTIRGGALRGLVYEMPIASAQVKSCLLLAGLRASAPSTIIESAPSRDHTERLIHYGGGSVERVVLPDGRAALQVTPAEGLRMDRITVPGDFSSAAFFIVGALLVPNSEVVIENVGLNPTRTALLDVLARMGGDLEVTPTDMLGPEPVGTVTARSSKLTATDVRGAEVAGLIDELPLYLLAAARAEGLSRLRDASELRAKETDRLRVMADTLRTLGAEVRESPDGMDVTGSATAWDGGLVAAEGDHRMAMVGAIAGLASCRGVEVDDTDCIAVSYPDFTEALTSLGGDYVERPR